MWTHKPFAFIRRDFLIESSYKLNYIMKIFGSVAPVIFFYFVSKLITVGDSSALQRYGDSYFDFVIIGLGFARFIDVSLKTFSDSLRLAQVTGCLEAMLSSQTHPIAIALMSSLYSLIVAGIQLILIFAVSILFLGMDINQANLPAAFVVFALSVLNFVGIGLLSAATIILIKRGDPVTWIFSTLGVILGGAYFPIEVMPEWLRAIAALIPVTYSLEAMRLTLLKGYSLTMAAQPVIALGIMTAIILPLGLKMFSMSVIKARRDGTLMHY